MSRRIRKVRRVRIQEYLPKTRTELARLVRAAFTEATDAYKPVEEDDRLFPEEMGYLKTEVGHETKAFSITMKLEVVYSTRDPEDKLLYGSAKLQDHLRAFARKHRNKFALFPAEAKQKEEK